MAAWYLLTVARGLIVMERAFGDEAQLRRIARHAVATVIAAAPGAAHGPVAEPDHAAIGLR